MQLSINLSRTLVGLAAKGSRCGTKQILSGSDSGKSSLSQPAARMFISVQIAQLGDFVFTRL